VCGGAEDVGGLAGCCGISFAIGQLERVPGAKARCVGGLNVRAEARTYLRSKRRGKARLAGAAVLHPTHPQVPYEWGTRRFVVGRESGGEDVRELGFEHGIWKKLRATRWVEVRLSNCTAEVVASAGGTS
jgi:hypothetical protein